MVISANSVQVNKVVDFEVFAYFNDEFWVVKKRGEDIEGFVIYFRGLRLRTRCMVDT